MEIRRSYDRLISTMGFPILVRRHFYIASGPRICWVNLVNTMAPNVARPSATMILTIQKKTGPCLPGRSISFTNAVSVLRKNIMFFNPLRANFFSWNINMTLQFLSFLHTVMTKVVEILPQVRRGRTYSTKSTSYGCWCPGSLRRQGISNHDINLVKPR